ncbi:hypothetical protein EDC96DRAFT_569643 [Choanephora cucurbitarum]|nr:hypothetical protein EDC96DRAFT_569643 [Choanephora cucurbitarum]
MHFQNQHQHQQQQQQIQQQQHHQIQQQQQLQQQKQQQQHMNRRLETARQQKPVQYHQQPVPTAPVNNNHYTSPSTDYRLPVQNTAAHPNKVMDLTNASTIVQLQEQVYQILNSSSASSNHLASFVTNAFHSAGASNAVTQATHYPNALTRPSQQTNHVNTPTYSPSSYNIAAPPINHPNPTQEVAVNNRTPITNHRDVAVNRVTPTTTTTPAIATKDTPTVPTQTVSTPTPVTNHPDIAAAVAAAASNVNGNADANATSKANTPVAPTTPVTPTTPTTPTVNMIPLAKDSPAPLIEPVKKDVYLNNQQNAIFIPSSNPVTSSFTSGTPEKLVQETTKTYNKEDPADLFSFRFKTNYAIKPFRLVHDMVTTYQHFHIEPQDYKRLYLQADTTLGDTQGILPLTYIFTAWYTGTQERKCDWPSSLHVDFNGKQIKLQKKQKVQSATGNNWVGKDMPFDLTHRLREGQNTLRLVQKGCACSYYFSVQIYTRYSENYILDLVKKSTLSITETENLIDDLLGKNSKQNEDEDDIVILQSSLKLSLKCPITMKRMKHPVRGKKCRHIDCFDLPAYLLMNKSNVPAWRCPHCNHIVGPEDLARDLAMETRLRKLRKNVVEIEYTEDHSNYQIIKLDDPDSDDSDQEDENEGENQSDERYDSRKRESRRADSTDDHSSVTSKRAKLDSKAPVKQVIEPAVEVIDLLSDEE